MGCERIVYPNGDVTFICGRGSRDKRCKCGRKATRLCDAPLTGTRAGRTCDRPLCDKCATTIEGVVVIRPTERYDGRPAGDHYDLCPAHAKIAGANS